MEKAFASTHWFRGRRAWNVASYGGRTVKRLIIAHTLPLYTSAHLTETNDNSDDGRTL